MSEPTEYTFELKDLATTLVRAQGIHAGVWRVGFEFNFAATYAGPTPEEVRPSAVVQICRIVLTKVEPGEVQYFVVDAAEINPVPTAKKTRKILPKP